MSNDFLQGFAAAIATLARDFDRPTMAADICSNNGLTLADFSKASIEDFDMRPLRQIFKKDRP